MFLTRNAIPSSIDATEEVYSGPRLGRLINHGDKRELNCKMKVFEIGGKPALCLLSIR